ncbi:MAG: hypothetical protein N2545_11170 [Thermoflexales bacterium]|nr:hypothetical protein [Thermoflexales bacterium]
MRASRAPDRASLARWLAVLGLGVLAAQPLLTIGLSAAQAIKLFAAAIYVLQAVGIWLWLRVHFGLEVIHTVNKSLVKVASSAWLATTHRSAHLRGHGSQWVTSFP